MKNHNVKSFNCMIFIARMCRFLSLSICSSLLCLPLIGFANLSLSERLADLKARSSQHEDQVSVILGRSNLTPTNFETAVPVIIPEEITPPTETPAPPYIPIPEYYDSSESDVVREVPASSVPSVDDLVEDPNLIATPARDDDNQSKDDLEKAYDDLYEEDRVERHIGYYFGPIFSIAIPDDGAVRVPRNPPAKGHFDSDVGYLLGFQFGKDFGGSRFEAEYSYLNFDGSGILGKFENSSHNLLLRLLLVLLFVEVYLWLRQHTEPVVNERRMHCRHGEAGVLAVEEDWEEGADTRQTFVDLVEARLHHLKLLSALLKLGLHVLGGVHAS